MPSADCIRCASRRLVGRRKHGVAAISCTVFEAAVAFSRRNFAKRPSICRVGQHGGCYHSPCSALHSWRCTPGNAWKDCSRKLANCPCLVVVPSACQRCCRVLPSVHSPGLVMAQAREAPGGLKNAAGGPEEQKEKEGKAEGARCRKRCRVSPRLVLFRGHRKFSPSHGVFAWQAMSCIVRLAWRAMSMGITGRLGHGERPGLK